MLMGNKVSQMYMLKNTKQSKKELKKDNSLLGRTIKVS